MIGSRRAFTADEAARFAEAGALRAKAEGFPPPGIRILTRDDQLAALARVGNKPNLVAAINQARQALMAKEVLPLDRIAWGKRDAELAQAVRDSILKATPATVIPWRPGQTLHAVLRHRRIHTAIDDLPASHTHRFIHWTPSHD